MCMAMRPSLCCCIVYCIAPSAAAPRQLCRTCASGVSCWNTSSHCLVVNWHTLIIIHAGCKKTKKPKKKPKLRQHVDFEIHIYIHISYIDTYVYTYIIILFTYHTSLHIYYYWWVFSNMKNRKLFASHGVPVHFLCSYICHAGLQKKNPPRVLFYLLRLANQKLTFRCP